MRYNVEYNDNFGYGTEHFVEKFATREEAEARYAELNAKRWAPTDLQVVDTVAEAEAEIARLQARIAELKKLVEAEKTA